MAFVDDKGEETRKVEVFAWAVDDKPMIFFCPISGVMSGALEKYARSLSDSFAPEGAFLETAKDALTPAISHLLQEERQFGFGWTTEL